ncbi:MAG: VOC family protein [Endomicrobiales bacterium]|jgi:glyoxylase I family protein
MFKKIDHVEIIPTDINKTIEFYVSILGFKVRERYAVPRAPMKEIAYLELGGSVIEIISVDNPATASQKEWEVGYRAIAIEVEDMDATVNYLKEKGVAITWGPVAIGKAKRAEIKDPDGLPIELRQW